MKYPVLVEMESMDMVSKIRKLIRERGLTQSGVESAAMLSANRISKWGSDKGEPTAQQALRLARLLGVPVEYLIDDSLDDPPSSVSIPNDEQRVLELYRSLKITKALDVHRALAGLAIGVSLPLADGAEDDLEGNREIPTAGYWRGGKLEEPPKGKQRRG